MFQSYLDGRSTDWIAGEMNRQSIPTAWKRGVWHGQVIPKMLTNEKYIGDSLCQKTYTVNTFPFVSRLNKGETDQFYVENTHPAIMDREVFEKVQALMRKKRKEILQYIRSTHLPGKSGVGYAGLCLYGGLEKAALSHGDDASMIKRRQTAQWAEPQRQNSIPPSFGCTTSSN